MTLEIRPERKGDAPGIQRLTRLTFQTAAHRSGTEQDIIDALRAAGALTISRVAEIDGEIIGHIAISPVQVSSGATGWFGLGPVSVHPDHQRNGIGRALVTQALAELKSMGAAGCVLLGDPAYYQRFGFQCEPGLVLPGVPAEFFQAMSFSGAFPAGIVTYHDAFSTAKGEQPPTRVL